MRKICFEVIKMPDYKEMYLKLMRETEKAIRILQQAQLDCEELYLQSTENEPTDASPKQIS